MSSLGLDVSLSRRQASLQPSASSASAYYPNYPTSPVSPTYLYPTTSTVPYTQPSSITTRTAYTPSSSSSSGSASTYIAANNNPSAYAETISLSTSKSSTYTFVRSGTAWIPLESTSSDTKMAEGSSGPPIPIIVGLTVASILLVVAGVVGVFWFRHKRNKQGRLTAREMRQVGREEGTWPFNSDTSQVPRPPAVAGSQRGMEGTQARPLTRADLFDVVGRPRGGRASGISSGDLESGSERWEDDSEMDVLANDGSTIARTLSSTSVSTIRSLSGSGHGTARRTNRSEIDHPGYTYRSQTSSGPSSAATLLSRGASANRHTPISPFSDPSPNAPIRFLPRAVSRTSTVSENPFQDPLPEYSAVTPSEINANGMSMTAEMGTFELRTTTGIAAPAGSGGSPRGVLPRLVTDLPPPAYGELYSARRSPGRG